MKRLRALEGFVRWTSLSALPTVLASMASGQSDLPAFPCWSQNGNHCYASNPGFIGIGTANPAYPFDTFGSAVYVIRSTNSIASNGASAIFGHATSGGSVTIGVEGDCESDQGRGVFGASRNGLGTGLGVYGLSYGDLGTGVYGWAISPTGVNYGVYGVTSSPQGYAGYFSGRGYFSDRVGFNVPAPAYAIDAAGSALYVARVENSIASNGAAAIFGHATSPGSVTIGVEGDCESTTGRGVFGAARNGAGSAIGVYGFSAAGGASYGVFATGNMGATGVKPFQIDHPLDPANSYLLHYSMEAPEPQNMYNGIIALDGAGEAWVELPHYFAAINRDFRYQLTALDSAMPNLHVARRIQNNRFLIAGGQPGFEVSWEVKAIRNDPWVRKYGAATEVLKPENERGKYQHPDLYGMPPEFGINYRPEEPAASDAASTSHR